MLVLSRKPGEQLRIGDNITITVVEVRGNRVKIGIEAPATAWASCVANWNCTWRRLDDQRLMWSKMSRSNWSAAGTNR